MRKRESERWRKAGFFLKKGATERSVRMFGRIACRYDMLGAYLHIFREHAAASPRSRKFVMRTLVVSLPLQTASAYQIPGDGSQCKLLFSV